MAYASKLDQARYARGYYLSNKAKIKRAAVEGKRRTKRRNRRMVFGHLLRNPCVDCGETDPLVLEFDHVKGDKHGNIADLVLHVSVKRVVAELKKCVVRCANCHRRKTAADLGWYKDCLDMLEGAKDGEAQQVLFE